jgi:hypothetical protein
MNNDPRQPPASHQPDQVEPSSPGPNLALLYSLIALALVVAIGFALMIVLPFYHRR